jgi:hypothetical protein
VAQEIAALLRRFFLIDSTISEVESPSKETKTDNKYLRIDFSHSPRENQSCGGAYQRYGL